MLIELDAGDARPIYRQIADEVRRAIAVGTLREDEALPAVRQLAASLRLNPNTVQHAYRQLERERVVYVRRGRGTFVAPAAARKTSRQALARQVAERARREAFRHGVTVPDLLHAIKELEGRKRK